MKVSDTAQLPQHQRVARTVSDTALDLLPVDTLKAVSDTDELRARE